MNDNPSDDKRGVKFWLINDGKEQQVEEDQGLEDLVISNSWNCNTCYLVQRKYYN